MRYQPPDAPASPRVIVWLIRRDSQGFYWWVAKTRNGRLIAACCERFASFEQARKAAVMFGRPDSYYLSERLTVLHDPDGQKLILNWSQK